MVLKTHSKDTFLLFILCLTCYTSPQVTITTNNINENTQEISFTFALAKKDFLYKDFIQFSVANPGVTLSDWKTCSISLPHYDPSFKSTKHIFTHKVTISVIATAMQPCNEKTYLYFTYYQQSKKKMKQIEHQLSFVYNKSVKIVENDIKTSIAIDNPQKKSYSIQTTRLDSYLGFLSYYTLLLHTFAHNTEIASHLLITFFICICGIICIKKSTKITWKHLRTFYTLFGITLIASTVLFLFKTLQVLVSV